MPFPAPGLDSVQRALLEAWLPGARVDDDMSWGVLETTVLKVTHGEGVVVVKAGGPGDHHIAREIRAHREWTAPLVDRGRAARLVRADLDAKLLVTEYLPGALVQDSPAVSDPETYRQAGELLAVLHGQQAVVDGDFEARANRKALAWLDRPHRIPAHHAERLRQLIRSWPEPEAVCVPTHGDWQPRNWLTDDAGTLRVIDWGRADLRPPLEDFERLDSGEFVRHPERDEAFIRGYGSDPRRTPGWFRQRTRAGVSAACWRSPSGFRSSRSEGSEWWPRRWRKRERPISLRRLDFTGPFRVPSGGSPGRSSAW